MASIELGEHTVDLRTGAVRGPRGAEQLSAREREVLELLARSPRRPVSQADLGGPGGSRAADMAVSRLRRRLGADGRRIATCRGLGYRLDVGPEPGGLDLGWGRLDVARRQVRLPDREVHLSEQQARLLRALSEEPGRPRGREDLARTLWGPGRHAGRLDLLVHRLRGRLEADPARPRLLVSLRGGAIVLLDARPAREVAAQPIGAVRLFGREDEIRMALDLLAAPERLALLHGPPGVGKSAVAAAVAEAWALERPGRACLRVDLHGLPAEDAAEARLAVALGMDAVGRESVVARALASRGDLLLLVDGALPPRLGARMPAWAGLAPSLRILAAARAAVPGWPVIELGGLPDGAARALLQGVAGRDLGERALRICRRLDGNPLALALVGTGLRHGGEEDLDRSLALPLGALRRAWRACLADLPPADHEVALALSLFSGPFDHGDVAEVAGIRDAEAAQTVRSLLSRSVLVASAEGRVCLPHAAREILRSELRAGGAAGAARARYRDRGRAILSLLADEIPRRGGPAFDEMEARWPDLERAIDAGSEGPPGDSALLARLALEAAERAPRARRTAWTESLRLAAGREDLPPAERALCLRAVHHLSWDEQSTRQRELLLREALSLAAEGGDAVLAAAVAAELAAVIAFSFGGAEARRLLRAWPMPDDAPPGERIRHHRQVGRLGIFAGRPTLGLSHLQEGVALAERAGLPLLEARCRMVLGQALSAGTLASEAEHHLRRAIALTREHALPEEQVRASLRLAQHLLRLGLRAEAGQLLEEALAAAVRAGLTRLEEQVTGTLGYLRVGQRRIAEALIHLDRAVDLCREHGGQRALFVALCNRGLALSLHGDAGRARLDLREALDASGGAGGWYRALALAYQAIAELLDGDRASCCRSASEAAGLLGDLDHPDAPPLGRALEVLGGIAAGTLPEDEAAAWAAAWSGGAEVEGVVMGIEAALSPWHGDARRPESSVT